MVTFNPISVPNDNTTIIVAAGDEVRHPAGAVISAAIVSRGANTIVTVSGTVISETSNAIFLTTDPTVRNPDPNAGAAVNFGTFDNTSLNLMVNQGGHVSGESALFLQVPANALGVYNGFSYANGGTATATVDNSGNISGNSAAALVTSGLGTEFASIINRAGGTIFGINGNIRSISNAGLIDGGDGVAINSRSLAPLTITNDGTITASGSDPTIRNELFALNFGFTGGTTPQITNNGLISNTGTSSALSGNAFSIINGVSGLISGGSSVAIETAYAINLTNLGVINGNIVSSDTSEGGDVIDQSRGGQINGAVTLGGGDDRFIVLAMPSVAIDLRVGSLDGGTGRDTLVVRTQNSGVFDIQSVPNGFEQLAISLANNDVTLAQVTRALPGMTVTGIGSLTINAAISSTGPAISFDSPFSGGPTSHFAFVNHAPLQATLTDTNLATIYLTGTFGRQDYLDSFLNDSSIIANGGNAIIADISLDTPVGFINRGSVVANGGDAIRVNGVNNIVNSGTVAASGGAGIIAQLGGPFVRTFTNSGDISGSTFGALLAGTSVINTGTFRSVGGTAVQITASGAGFPNSLFDNRNIIDSTGIGISLRGARLLNSGSVTSSAGFAVSIDGYNVVIDNLATGTIGGMGIGRTNNYSDTVRITNAGTISAIDLRAPVSLGFAVADIVTNTGIIQGSVIFGGLSDQFYGANGSVLGRVLAGGGNDIIEIGTGSGLAFGENGDDTITGAGAGDTLFGDAGNDTLNGAGGRDTLIGGAGDDYILGGAGNNELIGGIGDDVYVVSSIGDSIVEFTNEGIDRVDSLANVHILNANVENLFYLGSTTFLGVGNSLNNFILGGTGRDTLYGLAGNDLLNDGGGSLGQEDTLLGGIGDDVYVIGLSGTSTVEGAGEGIDEVRTNLGNIVLQANIEILTFTDDANHHAGVGNALNNVINGGVGADGLFGRSGNDTLRGGSGSANTLVGQDGNDIYIVEAVGDTIIELVGGGVDTVQTALASFVMSDYLEQLTYTGDATFTGIGNIRENVLRGGAGDDFLSGLDGNDILIGKSGTDLMLGGNGADQFRYEGGETGLDRIIDFTSGTDKIALLGTAFARTSIVDFVSSGTPAATSANSTFLYNVNNGIVSYDADGTGAGAAVAIAQLNAGLALSVGDFIFY